MISVDLIAGRRLPFPSGYSGQFVASVAVGDAVAETAPAYAVHDSKLGTAVTFRDRIRLPLPSAGGPGSGVLVGIRSVDGTLNFGEALCTAPRAWAVFSGSCGEALCSYATVALPPPTSSSDVSSAGRMHAEPPASPPANTRAEEGGGRPAQRRPHTAAPSAAAGWRLVKPAAGERHHQPEVEDWAGVLEVGLVEVRGLSIPASRVLLTPVAHFAMVERRGPQVETVITSNGHVARLGCDLAFDVHPHGANTTLSVRFFAEYLGKPEQLVGEAFFPVDLGCEQRSVPVSAEVRGHPRSAATLTYRVVYHPPQREGSNGRPMSAHGPTHRHALPPRRNQAAGGGGGTPPSKSSTPNNAVARLRLQVAEAGSAYENDQRANEDAAHDTCKRGGGGSDALFGSRALELVEQRIQSVVADTVATVLERLRVLEVRVTKTENALASMNCSSSGSGGIAGPTRGSARTRPHTADSRGSCASRPSSAERYDVSQSCVTEAQLRAKFVALDASGTGYLTRSQLLQYYRESASPADESEEAALRFLSRSCGVDVSRTDLIDFDAFARVALKLAQS